MFVAQCCHGDNWRGAGVKTLSSLQCTVQEQLQL